MRPPPWLAAFAVLLALAAVACSQDPAGTPAAAGNVVVYEGDALVEAPQVVGETTDGERLALDELDGPVLINFWASWCGPCRREAPHLAAIDTTYGQQGLHVVGVNVRDTAVNARTFERDNGIAYPSWFDEGAVIAASFGGVSPSALPTTILLDAEHRVVAQFFGAVTGRQLAPHLDALVGGPPAGGGDGAGGGG